MTVLGAGLLWFGWFGFNAGSALAANGLAANAFVVTNTAAAMGALAWMTVAWAASRAPERARRGSRRSGGPGGDHPGLRLRRRARVASSSGWAPASSASSPYILKTNLGVDDALDVFGVHGVGGTWGALATGLFATDRRQRRRRRWPLLRQSRASS